MDATGKFGEHSKSFKSALLRFARSLQTFRVHPYLDIRTLSMNQLLKDKYISLNLYYLSMR